MMFAQLSRELKQKKSAHPDILSYDQSCSNWLKNLFTTAIKFKLQPQNFLGEGLFAI